jgi:hypothetical protein
MLKYLMPPQVFRHSYCGYSEFEHGGVEGKMLLYVLSLVESQSNFTVGPHTIPITGNGASELLCASSIYISHPNYLALTMVAGFAGHTALLSYFPTV